MTASPWDNDATLLRLGLSRDSSGTPCIVIPPRANIAADTVGRHARGSRASATALIVDSGDQVERWSFAELDAAANRLAAGLRAAGVEAGAPVAVHTGQSLATALAHLAIYKLGAVVMTLSQLYGPETVRHALADSGTRFVLTDAAGRDAIAAALPELPQQVTLVLAGPLPDGLPPDTLTLDHLLGTDASGFEPVDTRSDAPALLMYTSGSTGLPKGLMHAHRILGAYMPTVRLFYDLDTEGEGLVFWTPADWAWVGGLLDLVLPAWAEGHAVLACPDRFDATAALDLMARHRVTHSFMTPTALKRLAQVPAPRDGRDLALRVICTGGESLPGEVVTWCEDTLGVVCNEFYGLTEFNHLVGNCRALYPIRPGSMGRAYPGRRVAIVDETGVEVPEGEVGEIVSAADDPTLFLGYRGAPGVPDALRLGPWLRTRDLARRDADGYVWYQGRNDDLIKSAGYRIGPAEVEDALLRHPAVAEAAVVGLPDPERGQIVTAFVRPASGHAPDDALSRALREHVRATLAAYKAPRRVIFVDEFPMTSSGKIRRAALRRMGADGESG